MGKLIHIIVELISKYCFLFKTPKFAQQLNAQSD